MGTLYLVSTPIGNLGDVSSRALDVLRSASHLLAEDTRRTSILLRHYQIDARARSLNEHNEARRVHTVLAWLDADEDVALVSDAGTPLVSDPGARLVEAAIAAGHTVAPVPGASALLAALTASGLPTEPFTFYGFPPRSGRPRSELLESLARLPHTAVLYESPNRVASLLADLRDACEAGRRVVVARELTKVHETFVRGTLEESAAYYEQEATKGEVVVVLAGASADAVSAGRPDAVEEAARVLAGELLSEGRRPSAVAKELTGRFGLPRNLSYAIALELSESHE